MSSSGFARYLKVGWHHDNPTEPVLLLSEVVDGYEVRKVEVFADGHRQHAGPDGSTGDTRLGERRVPPDEEIDAQPVFAVLPTGPEEFEREYLAATDG